MAKTLNEASLTTRSARESLPPGVHWRRLDAEAHLGYRKAVRSGRWLVRWRDGVGYKQLALGVANDDTDKPVVGKYNFLEAEKKARSKVEEARKLVAARAKGEPLTVRKAVENYIMSRDARDSKRAGREIRSDANRRLGRYVLGQKARGKRPEIPAAPVADVELHSLKERDLRAWRSQLPVMMKATTRQRLVNDFKAALNSAYAEDRAALGPSLPVIIKDSFSAGRADENAAPVARENQILSDAEVARIIAAAQEVDAAWKFEGDLYRMVLVLAATGARFSQVARIRVSDCQFEARRLMVPPSRKGRGGGKSELIPVPVGDDVLEALRPVVEGRAPDSPLLERWRSVQQEDGVTWKRDRRGPWYTASEMLRPWRDIRQRANLPQAIPYSLRHSSIVKWIRVNLSIQHIAESHDTSATMISRHYARWITTGLEQMARTAIIPLVPPSSGRS